MLTSQILIQLIVILLAVQVLGTLCKCIDQPRVIGEILVGLALGPTLLGTILPRVEAMLFPTSTLPTLQTLCDIGLVLYMFSLGTHIATHTMLRNHALCCTPSAISCRSASQIETDTAGTHNGPTTSLCLCNQCDGYPSGVWCIHDGDYPTTKNIIHRAGTKY